MQAKVSFTQKVKEELCSIPFSDEHLRAFLAAFIKVNGHLSFRNGQSMIVCKTENAKIAKFIYQAVDRIYGITPRFSYSKTMNFKKKSHPINKWLFTDVVIWQAWRSPASLGFPLLVPSARGCHEIYHLKYTLYINYIIIIN